MNIELKTAANYCERSTEKIRLVNFKVYINNN